MTDYSSHSAASEQTPADTADSSNSVSFDKTKPSALTIILNAIRGGLIGLAELVPGVSGGTIALVTGVYERVLYNANVFLDGMKTLTKGRAKAGQRFRDVDWWLLIPMLIGMGLIVVLLAGPMKDFVTHQPIAARALFLGMVMVSIAVPMLMIDWKSSSASWAKVLPVMGIFAVLTFWATGFTSTTQREPNLIIVFLAAAVAICALVLPGVSGSFFLLAVGLYEATLGAVDERNFTYLGVFALGALTGIVLFVRLLEKMLNEHRTVTLAAMAGLLLGSLRALWPWQDDAAGLLAPGENIGGAIGLFVLGAAIVAAMIVAERRFGGDKAEAATTA